MARLSGLYTTLTARLALRDPLLALSGRLELVLSQIELRASTGPTPLAPESKTTDRNGDKRRPLKYVEGESESEEDDEGDEMEIERDDGTGSIEDVELGAKSASDEGEESASDEGELEDDESEEGPRLNGFIDDEAEEWSDDDDDDYDDGHDLAE